MGLTFTLDEVGDDAVSSVGRVAVVTAIRFREEPSGKEVEFVFKLDSADDHGDLVCGDTSTRFDDHPNCRLRKWVEAILGVQLSTGDEIDSDSLIGRRCRVVIGEPEWKDNEIRIGNRVRSVRSFMDDPVTVDAAVRRAD
jgi:hypothetical protein